MLTTIIADDEPVARERIRSMLAEEPDIEVVGEAPTAADAIATIVERRAALVFLDAHMPGLDALAEIALNGNLPAIIFVTGYDEYAIQAFEAHSLDYLVKPFNRVHFQKTLQGAREKAIARPASDAGRRLAGCLDALRGQRESLDRVVIRNAGRVVFLAAHEIDWIEAAGNYVKIYAGQKQHVLRETLENLEKRLDPQRFVRVHRSTILNVDRLRELRPLFHGDQLAILTDGTRVTCSRSYAGRLEGRLATG